MTSTEQVSVPADDGVGLAAAVVGRATRDLRASIASRLDLDADVPVALLLAELDRRLQQPADNPNPPGTVMVDADALADLERDAETGRNVARDATLADAVRVGRISPAQKRHFSTLMDTDPIGTTALLRSIPAGTIPVSPRGRADDDGEGRDLLREVFGT